MDALIGRPLEEIFIGLAEHVCPVGGSIDQAIARDAFIETIIEMSDLGVTDLSTVTGQQLQTVFELYIAHTIEARICNDIGMKLVALPDNPSAVANVQGQLFDFIRRAASDALAPVWGNAAVLTSKQALALVDSVYQSTFELLRVMSEAEADKEA